MRSHKTQNKTPQSNLSLEYLISTAEAIVRVPSLFGAAERVDVLTELYQRKTRARGEKKIQALVHAINLLTSK